MKGINQPQNYALFINFRMFLFRLLSTCPFSNNPQKYQKKKKKQNLSTQKSQFLSMYLYSSYVQKMDRWSTGGKDYTKHFIYMFIFCYSTLAPQILHWKIHKGWNFDYLIHHRILKASYSVWHIGNSQNIGQMFKQFHMDTL